MPLPKHKPGEDRNKFVNRCMSDPNSKKDFSDTKQRIAYCVKEAREDAESSLISDVHDELLIANAGHEPPIIFNQNYEFSNFGKLWFSGQKPILR